MSVVKLEMLVEVNLKAMRLGCGLTLRSVARKTGIDASNYSRMERGKVIISEYDWEKIIKTLKNKE